MTSSLAPHRLDLLAALLGAVAGCSRASVARTDDQENCVSVSCLPRPSAAPSQTAPVFEECAAVRSWETSVTGPDGKPMVRWEPFSIGQTREARRAGKPDVCCYEGPGMCGVGRPLVIGASVRTASRRNHAWG